VKIKLLRLFIISIIASYVQALIPHNGLFGQTYQVPEDPTKRAGGLTDQEYNTSKEFKHQGLIDRKTKELCTGNENTCAGEKSTEKILGVSPGLIEAVGQSYAMVIGVAGGDFTLKPEKETELTKNKFAKDRGAKKETTKNDYCKYIATAVEKIATFKQVEEQRLIQSAPSAQQNFQKEQFYKSARMHKARSESAKIQTYGWGTTTACYGYMMASGTIVNDWKVIAKTAAAGFLTWFYHQQIGRYDDQAKKVKEIAEAVPGKGDCNPITQRQCYCMQPETQNDGQYCLPILRPEEPFAANTEQTTCVDNNLKEDPQCKCTLNDTCFDKTFYSQIGAGDLGQNFQQNVTKPVKIITTGNIPNENLSAANLNKLAANAKKTINQFKNEIAKIPQLSSQPKSKNAELVLTKNGIPTNLARKIAQAPTSAASKSLHAALKSGIAKTLDETVLTSGNSKKVLYFGGKKKKRRARKSSNEFNFLNSLRKKKKKQRHPSNIINFANKAQERAQISRQRKNIFQQISRRYQVSGEKRLK